jgi:predicted transporter
MRSVKDCFRNVTKKKSVSIAVTFFLLAISEPSYSQDGNAGINQATDMVKSYFDSGANLMYAIGALVGLVGGVKVFNKWNHGDHDTGKTAAAWFGSCVFLVVVATVIKSFFGI